MASSAPGQSLLTVLPARPPTPPREASTNAADVSLKSMLARPLPSESQSSLQTPPNVSTPSSAGTESEPTSTRLRKKVGWSKHTDYKDPPLYREGHKTYKSSPLSAPSSSLSKPVKGILKPSSSPHFRPSPLGDELHGPASQATITEMLDSTIKQLAGSDRDSKLDAYMMLSRALKASNNLPDRVALQDKMSLFMQFIQRDVTCKNEKGQLDSSLVNHALNLLATFLHFPAIASMLGSDFAIFITEHSIRGFQDPNMPKDVIRHLMQVMAFQNFPAKVITTDRVGRLVAALHKIEDHVKGKGIVMGRIQIYKRLVKQSRTHLALHPDWLKDVFTDMLSTVKDIRSQAISLGLEAGFALRSDKQFMRKVTEILQTTSDDQIYIRFYIQRLEEMIKDKTMAAAVPQIWSAVTLFLRCPLDRWEYFNPWLKLAQSAFNSADGQTKQEANYAWSRYIYLCLLDGKPTPKALGILCQPLLSQLRRKSPPKPTEEASKLRRVVIGAICTLLYYGFKPSDNRYSQDLMWDVVVQPIVAQLSNAGDKPDMLGDNMMQASRILVGLLDASTPRVWREDRIMDLPLVKPEELPSVDPKWVRRCSLKVFQAVSPILEKRFLDLAKTETMTYRLWHALVGSVAAASRKDIKVSEDTSRFFAHSFSFLSRVWANRSATEGQSDKLKLYSSIQNFVKVLFDGLGMLAFTEKKLSMTTPHAYEPAATPSHHLDRNNKLNEHIRSPLHHLFLMLSSDSLRGTDNDEFLEFFLSVFEPFFSGKPIKFRLELARELIDLLPREIPSASGPWILAAKHIGARFELAPSKSPLNSSSSDRPPGPEYREVVNLLERGLLGQPKVLDPRWIALFKSLSDHVVEAFGDAGRGLVVVDPLARFLLENHVGASEQLTGAILHAIQLIFEVAKLPRDRQALETARRRLWGAPALLNHGTLPDLFDNLYKLGDRVLSILYDKYGEFKSAEAVVSCVQAVCLFLEACLERNDNSPLLKLQNGLCSWLQDEQAQLQLSGDTLILQPLQNLWVQVCKYLANHQPVNRSLFDEMEPLLTAAFKSRHEGIVTEAVQMWNELATIEEDVDCSSSLRSVVSTLHSKVNATPQIASGSSGNFGAQTMPFAGAQADVSFIASSVASSSQAGKKGPVESAPVSRASSRSASSRKRRIDSTPDVIPTRRSKRKSTPRLRHDDSQIQFAPIASSPLVEDSQHLTEHQLEVRERQREATAMFPEIRSSSPGQSAQRSTRQSKKNRKSSNVEQQASTPKRAASYEELISSTPTPRRGQLIHLDELNDPPSSPPEPRPYPLLSEIQSRSRASASLENWEFSSPPTSPVTSRQRVANEVELPHVTLTNDSTQFQDQPVDSRLQDAEEAQVIPSSFDIDVISKPSRKTGSTLSRRERLAQTASVHDPATPSPQRRTTRQSSVQETPKSVDEEFVDARSSPEPSLPDLPQTRAQRMLNRQAKESSVVSMKSEGSNNGHFSVELESRPSEMSLLLTKTDSPEKAESLRRAQECIRVHTDSSPSPKKEGVDPNRLASPEVVSTALEEATETRPKESKKKRKRGGAKSSESRQKKRRSEAREASQQSEAPAQDVAEQSSPVKAMEQQKAQEPVGVQTRRSAKRQRQEEENVASMTHKEVAERNEADAGDTDEELFSQLVTESEAASQGHSQPDVSTSIDESVVDVSPETKLVKRRRSERKLRLSKEEEEANTKTNRIIETLRGGLGVLRDAKLSRENVYEIEDILMDMKRELFQAERRGRGAKSK